MGSSLKWISKSDQGPHEANFLKLDCSRIKNVFGWNPRWHVEMAIEKVVEWTRVYLGEGNIRDCMERQVKEYFGKG